MAIRSEGLRSVSSGCIGWRGSAMKCGLTRRGGECVVLVVHSGEVESRALARRLTSVPRSHDRMHQGQSQWRIRLARSPSRLLSWQRVTLASSSLCSSCRGTAMALRWPRLRFLTLWRSQRPHMHPLLPLLRHPAAVLSPATDLLPSLVTSVTYHHPHPSPARWSPLQCGVHLPPAHLHLMPRASPLAPSHYHLASTSPPQSQTPPSSS